MLFIVIMLYDFVSKKYLITILKGTFAIIHLYYNNSQKHLEELHGRYWTVPILKILLLLFRLLKNSNQSLLSSTTKPQRLMKLIKKNETLVELLKEKRQAIISHAVTKGLNPNAKMKDSGIEWIREIPEKWEVKKLKHLTTEKFKNGIFKKKEFYGSGIKLINVF